MDLFMGFSWVCVGFCGLFHVFFMGLESVSGIGEIFDFDFMC